MWGKNEKLAKDLIKCKLRTYCIEFKHGYEIGLGKDNYIWVKLH